MGIYYACPQSGTALAIRSEIYPLGSPIHLYGNCYSFQYSKPRFSAVTQTPYSLDWDEDALILEGVLWDRIKLSSKSYLEIANGEGVSRLLQVF